MSVDFTPELEKFIEKVIKDKFKKLQEEYKEIYDHRICYLESQIAKYNAFDKERLKKVFVEKPDSLTDCEMSEILKTKEDLLEILSYDECKNWRLFEKCAPFIQGQYENDKEFFLKAVKINGLVLQYSPEEMRNDKEIVMSAIYNCGRALEYASYELRNNKEFVFEATKHAPCLLKYASPSLKDDKEFILELAKYNIFSIVDIIKNISERLKNDKELILDIVKMEGRALIYASTHLQADIDIYLTAIKNEISIVEIVKIPYSKRIMNYIKEILIVDDSNMKASTKRICKKYLKKYNV